MVPVQRIEGKTERFPQAARPELTGDAVFGPDEIHKKLKEYKLRLCGGDIRVPL